MSITGFGKIPIKMVSTSKGANIKISLLVRSTISDNSSLINAPKIIRLYNHKEYVAAKTTPVVAKTAKYVLMLYIDSRTKNSPTKPLVPGNPRLAKIKIIKLKA